MAQNVGRVGFTSFQPSELAKIAEVILGLSTWFNRVTRPDGYDLKDLIPVMSLLAVPMFLILQEPDLGHTLMLVFIGGTMVIFQKLERRTLILLLLVGFVAIRFLDFFVLRDYQKNRVLTLLDSEGDSLKTGWHAKQARIAVGSGRFLGKGHGQGTQVAGGFLPENRTDFVFAHLAEEHGFVGGGDGPQPLSPSNRVFFARGSRARDRYSAGVAVGVGALIFWHVLMNVGMVLNVLPVTGALTLPLLSYGGTSAITVLVAVGLLLNIEVSGACFGLVLANELQGAYNHGCISRCK